MFLAEASDFNPPVHFAGWLASACFLIWFLLLVDKGIQRVRGKAPHPPNSQLEAAHNDLERRVNLLESLHEQFADKKQFEDHVKHCTNRHNQLFTGIDRVERASREALEKRIAEINADRARTMEKLNDHFLFIREAITEMKTKIEIIEKNQER